MDNLLTDRAFWENYWKSKKGLSANIPSNYLFHHQLTDIINTNKIKSAIELGGFPGYYAVFLKRYFNLDVALLDYFIHPPIVEDLLGKNELKTGDIQVIEADLFNYKPLKQYDLVLSCGLIEHFNDTEDIIKKHIAFLKPGGTLFITLPNFKSVNGWFQKKFDKENYDKHNINSMDTVFLADICKKAGMQQISCNYSGRFSLWLENEETKPLSTKILKKTLWWSGKIATKLIPFDSKALSPYIVLNAVKPK